MSRDLLKIAIAEPSVIIRSGIAAVLKRIPGFNIQPIEVVTIDALSDCMRMHRPDILIINPVFLGYNDIPKFKSECGCPRIKCIAFLSAMMGDTILKSFDETISMYDDTETITAKFNALFDNTEANDPETLILSPREKEIVAAVARGLTNKEIAEKLYLSAHTVITHRRNIARKLQIHSAAGLTIYAIVNKLVELDEIKKDNL
ncbi:response regulator transcription factor [Coprobacter tertius]|uniref:Response regulator transcription factor n=1 Tax=Coprobacter tertius TaxID=2944915 RepID=A0ABT1MLP4_9BACT|nr:response regulator transcription factor [Coprobacter tertius]MCP9612638.1 response regulator transcription factor [Coprobacter tertius]